MEKRKLVDISHVTMERTSLTVSIPRKIADQLEIVRGDVVAFKIENGKVVLEKIK